MLRTLFAALVLLATQALPCSKHPGKTHEEWTSAIQKETNKDGSLKTLSSPSDFFSESKREAPKNDAPSDRSSRPRAVSPY